MVVLELLLCLVSLFFSWSVVYDTVYSILFGCLIFVYILFYYKLFCGFLRPNDKYKEKCK